jgi:hypothetical protein
VDVTNRWSWTAAATGNLRTVCDYVHLNPVRAKLLGPGQSLRDYRWSSYPAYLAAKRVAWLRVDRMLGELGIPKDSVAGRSEFERPMQERARRENPEDYRALRRGWCLGDKAFRKELLGQMAGRVGAGHYGAGRRESGEEKAKRMVAEELKRRRWTEATLRTRRKGDREKVKIAARLRHETIMTLKWIAQRLQMGSWTHVSNCLAGQAIK